MKEKSTSVVDLDAARSGKELGGLVVQLDVDYSPIVGNGVVDFYELVDGLAVNESSELVDVAVEGTDAGGHCVVVEALYVLPRVALRVVPFAQVRENLHLKTELVPKGTLPPRKSSLRVPPLRTNSSRCSFVPEAADSSVGSCTRTLKKTFC